MKGATSMKPIRFHCQATLKLAPEAIANEILNLANWPQFQGYGVLPGIKSAQFETQTPQIVGSRIQVTNTDGSRHVEQIIEWRPQQRLVIRMQEFSPPLSRLATHFVETWEFQPTANATLVVRSFELHPRSLWTRLPLKMISFLLKRAIARQLRQMA